MILLKIFRKILLIIFMLAFNKLLLKLKLKLFRNKLKWKQHRKKDRLSKIRIKHLKDRKEIIEESVLP